MTPEPIVCPVCTEIIDSEQIDWSGLLATCTPCQLTLSLVGDVLPPRPMAGYPDRICATHSAPAPKKQRFVIQRRAAQTTVRAGGLLTWISKSVMVDPTGVTIRSRFGRSMHLPLAQSRGFIWVQNVWSTEGHSLSTFRVKLASQNPIWWTLFEFPDFTVIRHITAVLNDALDQSRLASAHPDRATAHNA